MAERKTCFVCGGPLRMIRPGLWKCYECGQYIEERGKVLVAKRMEVYPKIDQVRKSALEGLYEISKKEGEVEIPFDPQFLEFLQVASAYGAPKSMEEFQKLNKEDQLFYLGAFQEYLKEEEKRKRVERLKKQLSS
jgi:uncharacterized protein YdeI (YjbR/CyaY-like superfamily)